MWMCACAWPFERVTVHVPQRTRELSVRRKLNAMPAVFEGRSVLLVDDSIVRGTTMSQIVDMVRRAGAKKVRTGVFGGPPLCVRRSSLQ